MAISVTRIWRAGTFQQLSHNAKLCYIYLITSPGVNSLGLLNTTPESIGFDLKLDDQELRAAVRELIPKLIETFVVEGQVYFYIHGHFSTLARSITVSKKAKKEFKELPEAVVEEMERRHLIPDIEQHTEFKPPSVEEIEQYGVSQGHLLDGKFITQFYEGKAKLFRKSTGWYDSRGKEIRDWKAKIRNVWCKDENKIEECKEAPKGFSHFIVKDVGGRLVAPKSWRDGLPYSNNGIADDMLLQKEYKKRKG